MLRIAPLSFRVAARQLSGRGRLGRQVPNEVVKLAPLAGPNDLGDVELIEPMEIGLYLPEVRFEDFEGPDDFPGATPQCFP